MSPNNHSTEDRTSLIAEELTLHCEMAPANEPSGDRRGRHRCTLAAHGDRKQTSVNSAEAENPEAFQHDAFFLLGKIKKYVCYLQIMSVSIII